MNVRRDRQSPWGVRLYFESAEFDVMMHDLTLRAEPGVFVAGQGIDVERVLRKALYLEADFVDLPEGLLGRTLFHGDGRAQIEVSRALADAAETDRLARRRLRTTLAHECGHVACHVQLFLGDTETLGLFPPSQAPAKPAILCRESSVDTQYNGEWWEFQANQCMAALLLPKRLFIRELETTLAACRSPSFVEAIKQGQDETILRALADTFDVSWQSVLLRLQELGFAPKKEQVPQKRLAL